MTRQLLLAVATSRPLPSATSTVAVATRRPGFTTTPVAVSVPLPVVTGRRYVTVIPIDVYPTPAPSVVCTAQPAAESASVQTSPPCTTPIGLYTDSSGVHANTTRPASTSTGHIFSSTAIGGAGITPAASARMNSSPDIPPP